MVDALLAKDGEEEDPEHAHEGLEAARRDERDRLGKAEEAPQPWPLHVDARLVHHAREYHEVANANVPGGDCAPGDPDAARVHEGEVEKDVPTKDAGDGGPDDPREKENDQTTAGM